MGTRSLREQRRQKLAWQGGKDKYRKWKKVRSRTELEIRVARYSRSGEMGITDFFFNFLKYN